MRSLGGLVLAGGKGQRIGGCQKALLRFQGRTFLERLELAFSGFEELLLSSNDPALAAGTRFRVIVDEAPGLGPLEGLRAALSACRSDGLVVTACDVPLFSQALACRLAKASGSHPAIVCLDRMGGLHPLCGVYTKACIPAIEETLAKGSLCVRDALRLAGAVAFPLAGTDIPDEALYNINTPEELAALTANGP